MRIGPHRELLERNRAISNARKAGQTYASIGKDFGVRPERIRQICLALGRYDADVECWDMRRREGSSVKIADYPDFSVRLFNLLRNSQMEYLHELEGVSADRIASWRTKHGRPLKIGRKSVVELKEHLDRLGIPHGL